MFSTTVSIFLGLTAVGMVLHLIGVWAMFRVTGRRRTTPLPTALPPVTLLKPIKGLEDDFEDNLRSVLSQDYSGARQVIFSSTEQDDPGMHAARRIADEFPDLDCLFVLSEPDFGYNPKVANMQGAIEHARHELVLQTDANVRMRPGYLQELVAELLDEEADMIGSLVVGAGEQSAGSALDNVQLTCFTAPGMCIAQEIAHIPCIVGKSMLFRRSALEDVGGLASVKDLLAEDFMLAGYFERARKKVVLSPTTITSVSAHATVDAFMARHARWLQMRAVVSVPGFIGDLCANASVFALAAFLVGGLDPVLGAIYVMTVVNKMFWDNRVLLHLRGTWLPWRFLWASAGRDVLLAAVWVYAVFARTTVWRGERLRLGRDSLLTPEPAALPARARGRAGR